MDEALSSPDDKTPIGEFSTLVGGAALRLGFMALPCGFILAELPDIW